MKHIEMPVLQNKLSICMRKLIRYNDLGFVLNNLESSILLPIPAKMPNTKQNEFVNNKNLSLKSLSSSLGTYERLSEELTLRESTFKGIREFYPDFCTNIKDSLNPEQYKKYMSLLTRISQVINYTIGGRERNISSEELLLQKQDIVSKLIDSQLASEVGFLEDTFVLKELENLDLSKLDETILRNIEEIKRSLTSRIQSYEKYSKLYSAKEVRFTIGYSNNEGREI